MSLFTKTTPTISVKDFYAQHKDEILKLVSTEHLERTTHANLKYEITSQSGKRYYSFPEKTALPFMRMAKGIELMDWLKNGISPEDFDQIRSELTVALAHIKARTKDASEYTTKAGLLISEMERRRVQALPYYVLINLCANYLIREDEDPQVISSAIHHQKCDDIQNEIETGNNAFFFNPATIKTIERNAKLIATRIDRILEGLAGGGKQRQATTEPVFIVDRTAKRQTDLFESVMMLCEGDVVQYNQLLNGSVSLYMTKLQQFVTTHKQRKKKAEPEQKRGVPKR